MHTVFLRQEKENSKILHESSAQKLGAQSFGEMEKELEKTLSHLQSWPLTSTQAIGLLTMLDRTAKNIFYRVLSPQLNRTEKKNEPRAEKSCLPATVLD